MVFYLWDQKGHSRDYILNIYQNTDVSGNHLMSSLRALQVHNYLLLKLNNIYKNKLKSHPPHTTDYPCHCSFSLLYHVCVV